MAARLKVSESRNKIVEPKLLPKNEKKRTQDTILSGSFIGRSFGSTIMFRDLLTFSTAPTGIQEKQLLTI